ncbi:hypothetical protein [Sphingomonas endolithica]|uniref:hypothetical protein n=1 Tax=Sphingomonas endolithica TaxID=2972485 RepID=UPI0021AE5D62|nr:hypothetical protein [Sphingomonas sp. ZFBP2030]
MTNSEAFYRFHRFNESFDRNLKVTIGALEGLRTGVFAVTTGRTNLPIGNEPWRKLTALVDPVAAAESAIRLTATMGIVRVSAALDDFLVILEADFDRTAFTRSGATAPSMPLPRQFEGLKIPEAAAKLGLDPSPLAYLMPFHRYFTSARNCIVHRNGRANAELVQIARSLELSDCHTMWPTRRGTPVPALPVIEEGAEVDWLPRHAILCLSVYYAAAKWLNDQWVAVLGPPGLVYMAAHYALLDADPVAWRRGRSVETVIRTALDNRYRYRALTAVEIIDELRTMDKWRTCSAAFAARMAGNA